MTDLQLKLLEYIDVNYDIVIKTTIDGESIIIKIDLIPNDGEILCGEYEHILACERLGIDFMMLSRSYPLNKGDGFRMGSTWIFTIQTTSIILNDLEYYIRMKKFKFIETL